MSDYLEKKCPHCGQKLRVSKNIGGMLMACPSCGAKFYSDFKIGGTRRAQRGILLTLFELPSEMMSRLGRYFRRQ